MCELCRWLAWCLLLPCYHGIGIPTSLLASSSWYNYQCWLKQESVSQSIIAFLVIMCDQCRWSAWCQCHCLYHRISIMSSFLVPASLHHVTISAGHMVSVSAASLLASVSCFIAGIGWNKRDCRLIASHLILMCDLCRLTIWCGHHCWHHDIVIMV